MTRITLVTILAAATALAGCNQEPAPPPANETVNAPVVLPPAIIASKIYRCKDNAVVYIDWLSDNQSANIRTEQNGPATHVMAPEAGQPMVADGFSLTGAAADPSVSLTRPGKGSSTCHA